MSRVVHHRSEPPLTSRSGQFWHNLPQIALLALLAVTFAIGGSSRADIGYAAVTQTLAVLCLGIAVTTIRWRHMQGYGLPIALALGAVLLPALQLIPLPPELWQALPGRALIADIDRLAGLGTIWRPLTMTPPETISALLSALTPLTVLLLAVQLPPGQQARLIFIALGYGALSALTGLLQLLGDPQGSLYLFASTNNGSAVGLFANRNHQAVALACIVPLAFAAARLRWTAQAELPSAQGWRQAASSRNLRRRQIEWRMPLAIAAACILVPLSLVTGSRSGLMMTLFALVSLPFVMASATRAIGGHRPRISHATWLAIVGFLVVLIAGAAIYLGRDAALDRLFGSTPFDDLRLQMLPTLLEVAQAQWLWGTGIGSFERVYQIHEPARLLLPQYVNHAHNDWLELVITGGLPAIALTLTGLIAIGWRASKLIRVAPTDPWQPLKRAALVCMLILGLASISDYPLRTPYLAAFFALCSAWLFMPAQSGVPADAPNSAAATA